ncbi:MAG: class I SAM-dependent methyltransferase [Oscillibacter sp.]|nr:class I SAM-dependent methyltransferase [Oscillibacter sp.]
MKQSKLLTQWLAEEQAAHIHGWDFSHIDSRYQEGQNLPWDYEQLVRQYLRPESRILDIDTGGGEFLLSMGHPYHLTSVTESYPPNVALCRETLVPLGIDFHEADGSDPLPFPDESFDLVLNRHGEYIPQEIFRILKPGGIFITQQVGAENDRELVELLLREVPSLPFPKQYLSIAQKELEDSGLKTLEAQEAFRPIRFWDVGALVWFARIIEWEFPGFSVERCKQALFQAQDILERDGVIEGQIHRYLLIVQKAAK